MYMIFKLKTRVVQKTSTLDLNFSLASYPQSLNPPKIYKGNSDKYKGKIRNQYILVFDPKINFVECVRWLAAFLGSQCFF